MIFLGLVTIAQWLGLSILPPNKKISILLIGNHSAGKSNSITRDNREGLNFLLEKENPPSSTGILKTMSNERAWLLKRKVNHLKSDHHH